jgi:hypothetical protein
MLRLLWSYSLFIVGLICSIACCFGLSEPEKQQDALKADVPQYNVTITLLRDRNPFSGIPEFYTCVNIQPEFCCQAPSWKLSHLYEADNIWDAAIIKGLPVDSVAVAFTAHPRVPDVKDKRMNYSVSACNRRPLDHKFVFRCGTVWLGPPIPIVNSTTMSLLTGAMWTKLPKQLRPPHGQRYHRTTGIMQWLRMRGQ